MADRLVPKAPSLPLATEQYDARNIEQILRVLRLYFNQLDTCNQVTLQELAALGASPIYGAFFDTTVQTTPLANTAYAITFNTTDTPATSGFSRGTPTSRIYASKTGIYNIQFSAQLLTTSGGTHITYIWFRKNGNNIANSTTKITLEGNNTAGVAAWNFPLTMVDGDYFEIMWATNDTRTQMHYEASTALHPAIPSVILTVTPFNN